MAIDKDSNRTPSDARGRTLPGYRERINNIPTDERSEILAPYNCAEYRSSIKRHPRDFPSPPGSARPPLPKLMFMVLKNGTEDSSGGNNFNHGSITRVLGWLFALNGSETPPVNSDSSSDPGITMANTLKTVNRAECRRTTAKKLAKIFSPDFPKKQFPILFSGKFAHSIVPHTGTKVFPNVERGYGKKERHPSGVGGTSFLASQWCAKPPMALLLVRSLVSGFGFLGNKVYNFLKTKTK
jgi:hypothetical protein